MVTAQPSPRGVPLRTVLSDGRFTALLTVMVLSVAGDQVLRVALAVLVLARTGSAPTTALVYGATFLPQLAGGFAVGLADRWARRQLLVVCDLLRAGLVAVAAVPHLPLPALTALVVAVVALAAPFEAARSAVVPDLLLGEAYLTGSAVQNVALQAGMLGGFAVGGVLVAGWGAKVAIALDALTFLLSAAVVLVALARVPAARQRPLGRQGLEEPYLRQLRAGAALVWSQPWLRWLGLLACTVTGAVTLAEGLVAPYARSVGGGARAVGALTASTALGSVLGGVLLARFAGPRRRLGLMVPLAAATGLPLIGCLFVPGLVVSCLLWALTGAGLSFNLAANAAFVQALGAQERGRAFGLVAAALQVSQGCGVLLGAALAVVLSPGAAVAVGGLAATVCALALGARRPAARVVPVGSS